MASSSSALSEDQLQCSICLDVFTDPVSTSCGHNFCMVCLKECWDSSPQCQCPVCKEEFSKRPELRVNTFISELAAQFRKPVQVKSSKAPEKPPSKPKKVLCDYCSEEKLEALKSCLDCGLSYCSDHLKLHKTTPKLQKHKLIDPVENLEDYICQKHERPLELFCRDDQMCVCQFCMEGDHKTHSTVPIEEESGQKKSQLVKTQAEVQQMIQVRLKKIEEINHSVKLNKRNTEKEKADSLEVFRALLHCIERSQVELLEVYPSLGSPPLTKNWTEIRIKTHLSVETLRRALTQLQRSLSEEMEKLADTEMKRIQQHAVDVTLGPETAQRFLVLSDDGKQVTYGDTRQNLPDNPERFDQGSCVLGKEGFSSGRFYYEVQVRGKTKWDLGVVRESSNRKGQITPCPEKGYWSVCLRNETEYKAWDSPCVSLSLKQAPQKVGVFVDYEEGLVSFYDVEARSHIYSFTGQQESQLMILTPEDPDDHQKRLEPLVEEERSTKLATVTVLKRWAWPRGITIKKKPSCFQLNSISSFCGEAEAPAGVALTVVVVVAEVMVFAVVVMVALGAEIPVVALVFKFANISRSTAVRGNMEAGGVI
ncbi:hypothetical protein MHYP_G00016750 [Metynnis hypsauchen]